MHFNKDVIKTNQVLLDRLVQIKKSEGQYALKEMTKQEKIVDSLIKTKHAIQRKRQQDQIQKENIHLAQRILQQSQFTGKTKMKKDLQQYLELKDKLSKFRQTSKFSFVSQIKTLPPVINFEAKRKNKNNHYPRSVRSVTTGNKTNHMSYKSASNESPSRSKMKNQHNKNRYISSVQQSPELIKDQQQYENIGHISSTTDVATMASDQNAIKNKILKQTLPEFSFQNTNNINLENNTSQQQNQSNQQATTTNLQ